VYVSDRLVILDEAKKDIKRLK